ncbi:hypothetical protein Tco_1136946 [Tanacetum coccineum]
MDRLMDADSVLELNFNYEKVSVIDTNLVPSANVVVSNNKSAPTDFKVSDKGSLLEQSRKAREASTSKHISSMSDSDESEVEEVCMPDVMAWKMIWNDMMAMRLGCMIYQSKSKLFVISMISA